jgi:hypothetical protein
MAFWVGAQIERQPQEYISWPGPFQEPLTAVVGVVVGCLGGLRLVLTQTGALGIRVSSCFFGFLLLLFQHGKFR